MKRIITVLFLLSLIISCEAPKSGYEYNKTYSGKNLDHIAFPVGGMGAGMFCFEGTGAISHMSLHHVPDVFNEPCAFAAIKVQGLENGVKVLEANVPDYKKFGRSRGGMGLGGTTWGFPRFDEGVFHARFPFAELDLKDNDVPVEVFVVAWNPFIPNDEDNSGLPVAGLEYTFKNTSSKRLETIFSYTAKNFMTNKQASDLASIGHIKNGFVLHQGPAADHPEYEGDFAIFTDDDNTSVDHSWFRGGWFDPLTMAWNKVANGDTTPVEPREGGLGAALYLPVALEPGESKTIRLYMAWYVPHSNHRIGPEAIDDNDRGDYYDPDLYVDYPQTYEPWYSHRFVGIEDVAAYWLANYDSLKSDSELFTETFFDTTLPPEVIEAVSSNLSILKSTTIMRQHDGRMWNWEGSGDSWGSCYGSCKHVWNYAQALPNLFPRMERTIRETEFFVDQSKEGHQVFRTSIPIRPTRHDFHSACDGQLGGIIKAYRDWRITGDTEWITRLYPQLKASMDYCIRTWDPRHSGALEEPHHNTYDIEFWGADGMCTSIYATALKCFSLISDALGEECGLYKELYELSGEYAASRLWNGEYFIHDVRWMDLDAKDPSTAMSIEGEYSPEACEIMMKEGPKYQYGTGCLSDGVIGCWMAKVVGLEDPFDKDMVVGHLNSLYRYNLKKDLSDHANPQRPGYACGHEGGLLLCTWPKGGKPSLPFIYSDEVWTGIEYQVAAHMMFEGEVEKGLDIVRTCRSRYDGTIRNPFSEYECGEWYARALSSYSLLQALTGVRYDAVDKTLYIDSKIGDFRSFLCTASGYATVGLEKGNPFIIEKNGSIDVQKCIVSGTPVEITVI